MSDSGWAQIGGTYTVSTTATALVLYAQLVGPTSAQSFYLDDVVITEISGPPGGPQDNSGISTNFEDGALVGGAHVPAPFWRIRQQMLTEAHTAC